MSYILHLIAEFLFWLKYKSYSYPTKDDFEKNTVLFNNNIDCFLPLISNKIRDRLFSIKINNKDMTQKFAILRYIENDNSLRINFAIDTHSSVSTQTNDFIYWVQNTLGKNVTNDSTLKIKEISDSISFLTGDYYGTISSSDINYYKLVIYYIKKCNSLSYFLYRYKFVYDWLYKLNKPLFKNDLSDYCASVGCSVLLVLKCNNTYKYAVKLSDSSDGSSFNEKHVFLSFMLKPIEDNISFNIEHAIIENLSKTQNNDNARFINHLLAAQLRAETIQIINTGFIFDIFRFRPELTYLVILEEPQHIRNNIRELNWDSVFNSDIADLYDITNDTDYNNLLLSKTNPMCAPGAAALIFGREKALEILKKDGKLKNQKI